jgi:hypothetical protein
MKGMFSCVGLALISGVSVHAFAPMKQQQSAVSESCDYFS